jgi:nicotinamidase-related amidase
MTIEENVRFNVDSSMALTIINPQVDYGDEKGKRFVKGVESDEYNYPMEVVISNIVKLISLPFGLRVCSTDMHTIGSNAAEVDEYGEHCVEKTSGIKLLQPVKVALADVSSLPLRKGQDHVVIGNSVVLSPDFPSHIRMLRDKSVNKIFLCGLPFNSAVAMSAIEYINQHLGFKKANVYVILDATRSDTPPRRDPKGLRECLDFFGVKFVFAHQLLGGNAK